MIFSKLTFFYFVTLQFIILDCFLESSHRSYPNTFQWYVILISSHPKNKLTCNWLFFFRTQGISDTFFLVLPVLSLAPTTGNIELGRNFFVPSYFGLKSEKYNLFFQTFFINSPSKQCLPDRIKKARLHRQNVFSCRYSRFRLKLHTEPNGRHSKHSRFDDWTGKNNAWLRIKIIFE